MQGVHWVVTEGPGIGDPGDVEVFIEEEDGEGEIEDEKEERHEEEAEEEWKGERVCGEGGEGGGAVFVQADDDKCWSVC